MYKGHPWENDEFGPIEYYWYLASGLTRTLVAAKDSDANKKLIRGIIRNRKSKFLSTDFIL